MMIQESGPREPTIDFGLVPDLLGPPKARRLQELVFRLVLLVGPFCSGLRAPNFTTELRKILFLRMQTTKIQVFRLSLSGDRGVGGSPSPRNPRKTKFWAKPSIIG